MNHGQAEPRGAPLPSIQTLPVWRERHSDCERSRSPGVEREGSCRPCSSPLALGLLIQLQSVAAIPVSVGRLSPHACMQQLGPDSTGIYSLGHELHSGSGCVCRRTELLASKRSSSTPNPATPPHPVPPSPKYQTQPSDGLTENNLPPHATAEDQAKKLPHPVGD